MENIDPRQEELLTWLASEDVDQRETACLQLREFDNDTSRAALVALFEDADRGIRELAAEGLIQLGGTRTAIFLGDLLGHDNISIRNLASETLSRMGVDSVDAMIEKINDNLSTNSLFDKISKVIL